MANVAELKNIISSAMRGTLGEIGSELHNNLKSAERNIDKARVIISDFFAISQIDAGKMKLELAELSLRSVLSEVEGTAYSNELADSHRINRNVWW